MKACSGECYFMRFTRTIFPAKILRMKKKGVERMSRKTNNDYMEYSIENMFYVVNKNGWYNLRARGTHDCIGCGTDVEKLIATAVKYAEKYKRAERVYEELEKIRIENPTIEIYEDEEFDEEIEIAVEIKNRIKQVKKYDRIPLLNVKTSSMDFSPTNSFSENSSVDSPENSYIAQEVSQEPKNAGKEKIKPMFKVKKK